MGNTKGVWMWSAPIFVEDRDIHVILLDFEPFNQNSIDYDTRLMTLAASLSSLLVLN